MSRRALNIAMGWIVAAWLLAPWLSRPGGYAFYACMGGALVSVIVWAVLTRVINGRRG